MHLMVLAERCAGLGADFIIDPDFVVPDRTKSINQGAIYPWASKLQQDIMMMF